MGENFFFDLAVTTILSMLKASIKNPATKERIKPAMLKIASVIMALWGDDVFFNDQLTAKTDIEKSKM